MKIAIIGFGWLGFPLGKSLALKGHEIVGSTTTKAKIEALRIQGLSAVYWDLNTDLPQNLSLFFEKTDVCIINIPPKRNVQNQDFKFYGTQVLKAIEPFQADTKFIFVSSTGIYPDSLNVATETNFDRTKISNENHLAFAEETLHQHLKEKLTIVRMAGLIGEDRQIAKYFAGKTNLPNGNSPVNLIHQKDCIGIITKIIEENFWGELLNACASFHPSKKEYYTFCCEKLNLDKPAFAVENDEKLLKMIDNEKSKKLLGYKYQLDNPFDF